MSLYGKCVKILSNRGIAAEVYRKRFQIRDDSAGPYIEAWDADVLGPLPTGAELTAISNVTGAATAATEAMDRALADRSFRAMVLATFRLVKTIDPNLDLTLVEWKAMLKQAWKDVGA